jgi:DNA polymerase-3 subunit epsilon
MVDLFPALIFDFETTGLPNFGLPADDPSQPRICQVGAALVVEEGDPLTTIDCIIRPDGWTIPFDAARIHGITTERAEAEGVSIIGAMELLMKVWNRAAVIASYGMLFDTKMARSELRRMNMPDRFGEKDEFCVLNACRPVCKMAPTDRMMAADYRDNKPPKLAEACEIILGRKHEKAHTAIGDVMVTVDLYRWLAKRGLVTPKRRESFKEPIGSRGAPHKPAEAQPGRVSPEAAPAAADPFGVARHPR